MKNEKSTFSVLFYLKKDKMKKNGLVPIHARITIDSKQTQFFFECKTYTRCLHNAAPYLSKISGKMVEKSVTCIINYS